MPKLTLDAIDRRILRELQDDARLTKFVAPAAWALDDMSGRNRMFIEVNAGDDRLACVAG